MSTPVPQVVNAAWLLERLGQPGLQIIDGSWHIPARNRDAKAEFEAERILGAIHLDIDVVADLAPAPPGRMCPTAERFAEQVGLLGLDPQAHFVVYDSVGIYSSARVWWLFRTFGHDRVSVLEGGLPAWKNAGGAVESGIPKPQEQVQWPVRPARDTVRNWKQVLDNIDSGEAQLIDVRPVEMYRGNTANLYPGVREGHIPGALNVPRKHFLNADDTFLHPREIERELTEAGVDINRPIIVSCGSGVTACILSLAMELTGRTDVPVYDGSWEEWGRLMDLPVSHD